MSNTPETTAPEEPRHDAQNRRLCHARRSNGELCRAPAMNGQRVCRTHGGSSPQAKRSAAIRMAELVDPAVATLAREMARGDSSTARLRAAENVLDRTGHVRGATIESRITLDDAKILLYERLIELRAECDSSSVD